MLAMKVRRCVKWKATSAIHNIGSFERATSRGSREFLAVLEISGSQLNPLRAFSLNISRKKAP